MALLLARHEVLGTFEPHTALDASTCTKDAIAELVANDLSQLPSLNVSHNDLGSAGGQLEENILLEQWNTVNARALIKEGKELVSKSHKEKDFAVGAAKKREGQAHVDRGTEELKAAEDKLEEMGKQLRETQWSKIISAGLPSKVEANNCGLLAANLQLLLREDVISRLTSLSLDGNYFGDLGAQQIAEFMRKADKLEELSVRNTGLTDEGISIIIAPLVSNKTLRLLDLRQNMLTTSVSEAAIKGMQHFNKTTKVLF